LDVHVRHSLGFADVITKFGTGDVSGLRLLDLGTGGGVPGLLLAEHWPEASLTLLDVIQRRCTLLERWVAEAGLDSRVAVICGRAEELGRDESLRGSFDTVVARSFGSPAVTAECGSPFLKTEGLLVVSEPPRSSADLDRGLGDAGNPRWPAEGLAILGLEQIGAVSEPYHFVALRQRSQCPDRYPRRTGLPAKRPLF
jgi:16S rRNA (guanine527-N7)-methyltransferase